MDRYRAGSYPLQTGYQAIRRPDINMNSPHHQNDPRYADQKIFQQAYGTNQPQNIPGYRASTPINNLEGERKHLIKSKIQEIVKLCGDENIQIGSELKGIAQAEKQILHLFKESQANQKNQSRFKPNPNNGLEDIDQQRGTTFGPIRSNNNQNTQIYSKQYNKYKKSAIDDLKTQRNNEDGGTDDFGFQAQNIRDRIQGNSQLSDDAYQMIESIQRKAIEQIDALRQDKVILMKKLNKEIKAHNQQKRIRMELQSQVNRLRSLLQQNGINYKGNRKSNKFNSNKQKLNRKSSNYGTNQNINMVNSPIHEHQSQEQEQGYNNNIQREVQSLQYQNNILKQRLSGQYNPNYNSNHNNYSKDALVNQLNALRSQIKQYETQIQTLRAQQGGNPQIDMLLQQGQHLRHNANKIFNTKSPNNLNSEQKRGYYKQIEEYRKKIEDLKIQNKNLGETNHNSYDYNSDYNKANTYQRKSSLNEDYNSRITGSVPVNRNLGNYSVKRISEYQNILGQIRRANNL